MSGYAEISARLFGARPDGPPQRLLEGVAEGLGLLLGVRHADVEERVDVGDDDVRLRAGLQDAEQVELVRGAAADVVGVLLHVDGEELDPLGLLYSTVYGYALQDPLLEGGGLPRAGAAAHEVGPRGEAGDEGLVAARLRAERYFDQFLGHRGQI